MLWQPFFSNSTIKSEMYSSQEQRNMSPSSPWNRFEGSQGWQSNLPCPSQRDAANGRRNTTAENICPWLEHLPSQSCAIFIEAWCQGSLQQKIKYCSYWQEQCLPRKAERARKKPPPTHASAPALPRRGSHKRWLCWSSLLLILPRAWQETAQEKYRNSTVLRGKSRLIRSQTKKKRERWAIYSGSAFLREGKQNSFASGSEEHNIKHIWGLRLNIF